MEVVLLSLPDLSGLRRLGRSRKVEIGFGLDPLGNLLCLDAPQNDVQGRVKHLLRRASGA